MCETVLQRFRVDKLSNGTLFDFVDAQLIQDPTTEAYVQISTDQLPTNGLATLPVLWMPVRDSDYVQYLRRRAGTFNPHEKTMVIIVNRKDKKIVGGFVERLICCNPQCDRGDDYTSLRTCVRCGKKMYCNRRCKASDHKICRNENPLWNTL